LKNPRPLLSLKKKPMATSLSNMSTYRADPRLNQSTLKLWLDNEPSIAAWLMEHPKPPSEVMSIGTWTHKLIETNMAEKPLIPPYEDFKTKEARAWKEANPDFLKQDDFDKACGMAQSVLKAFPNLHTDGGKFEVEYYDENRKALLDYVSPCGKIGYDLKTTPATNLDKFRRDCSKFRYEVQAAWYSDIAKLDAFYFVGVSSAKPHPIFLIKACRASLNHGSLLIKRALRAISEHEGKSERPINLADAADMWEKQ
jgi:hypothetical protein